jgi:hypothetical protein
MAVTHCTPVVFSGWPQTGKGPEEPPGMPQGPCRRRRKCNHHYLGNMRRCRLRSCKRPTEDRKHRFQNLSGVAV